MSVFTDFLIEKCITFCGLNLKYISFSLTSLTNTRLTNFLSLENLGQQITKNSNIFFMKIRFKASKKSHEKNIIAKVILNTSTKKYQNHLWLLLIKLLIHFKEFKKYSIFERLHYSRITAEFEKSNKLTLFLKNIETLINNSQPFKLTTAISRCQ